MPRRGRVPKRKIQPDAVYNSVAAQRFINKMTRRGKRAKAENIFYLAMAEIKKKLNKEPMEVFEKAIANAAPLLEVKARRVGGATYQVPIEVTRERGTAIAMQWLRQGAVVRPGKSMVENLSAELIDAYNNTGAAIKNRENLHKTAEANKAFAHFRW
ncbi:30S ribosomal protein S7 [candidate division WOR-1 bacterium RIFCSPHIGHO2_01_FULL_53_15]|uniref:Small ribosomal subunit protein uS7 n=1 Tax=candidate division WOR-1 bacterium RIFCSPHIGHO2_01_FULL_53_15 TaxID=1802564 RepID=A0A1F4Q3T6_UNCSA|nr:MAG: 30S ribosomal protein S7 [candidate division WOR-1 bacterium RIFCSPHIGHO2_01_FULL_53_15]OGC12518.1 MAG: 30S ribosomal protein S7 [candidate division WOR-1 bacterium RIFCSPHIGHO2_02_FULL_53_26]